MLRKDKHGFLLGEETVKIVIAVICIGFLVYFLGALYFSSVSEGKLKQAEALLKNSSESIKTKINNLEEGNFTEFHLQSPRTWYLFGFSGNEKKPNSCAGQNCLCICDKVYIDTLFGFLESRQLGECDEDGTCLIVDNLRDFREIEINQQFIIIKKINNRIEIKEK